ncbi:Uncharacterized conserved protein YbbK, DUF523 family [Mariprofundus ferrinatatus]|uniref:Uncharacterized conserved protein YbbK, DUF523 family n=1 Tax=Mariprofundus ferrinatatus TaxID=1921087 RepID=A0A2K8L0V2_9PROT|nr:DUF523 domain-containing protein [Mariprofundus ferrinatatus]ATX80907.1 Uncharacterized conserved protein YbbK, DUF523 family [Mariprofundus ferrinatatus]
MQKILVSACLLGQKVRYDGGDCLQHGLLDAWQSDGRLVPFCPEVAGGLTVPRAPAEIVLGDADFVLRGCGMICTQHGDDVTDAFVDGAERALAECMRHGIRIAILKEGSPSCGATRVNDGSFSGRKIDGLGVTARLLVRHGVHVFSEQQLDAAEAHLRQRESSHG